MAIRFDVDGDNYSRTSTLPTITSFTMMGWIYIVGEIGVRSGLLSLGTSTAFAYYALSIYGTLLETWNGTANATGTTLSTATWYHLAITVAGTGAGQFLVYLNGVLDITANGASLTAAELGLASNVGNDAKFNGRMAAVKIYSAVLTAAEIANERLQYLPVRTANLNSFYPLLSTADDEIDYSGAGLTLTVEGTLATEDGPPIPWKMGRRRVYIPPYVAGPTIAPGTTILRGNRRRGRHPAVSSPGSYF